jgi:hypothetical protein
MNQHRRLFLIGTTLVVIAVIAAVFGTRVIRQWREDAIDAKASHVYDAIHAAGNWKLIRPIPEGTAGFPAGVDYIVVVDGAELEDEEKEGTGKEATDPELSKPRERWIGGIQLMWD